MCVKISFLAFKFDTHIIYMMKWE